MLFLCRYRTIFLEVRHCRSCVTPVTKGGFAGRAVHFPPFTITAFMSSNEVVRWDFFMKPPTLERFYLISVYKKIINFHL